MGDMFGLFKSSPFIDPQLGELRRSLRAWRGTLALEANARVPLVLVGSRAAPDPEALRIARLIAADFPSWRAEIERALFEHLAPYAEAVADGELAATTPLPEIDVPSAVWPHVNVEFVQVSPLDGQLTIEIGYRVTWDEEHTLGARIRGGKLVELCGSVLSA
jgi:hypothetical protein